MNIQMKSDRPWLASYDSSVPADIDLDAVPTMKQRVERAFATHADKPMATCMGVTKTYADMNTLSRNLAAYMSSGLGLQKGARVAVMLPNLLTFPISVFANIRAGLVQVNVNPMYTPRELSHQLRDAGAETIIIFENSLPTLLNIIAETPVKTVIVASGGCLLGAPEPSLPAVDGVQLLSFEAALAAGAEAELPDVHLGLKDLIFLQYTGGTTGLSKGAMLTHLSVSANIDQVNASYGEYLNTGGDVVITALPLYHIFALVVNFLSKLDGGSHNILVPNPTDMPGFVKLLQETEFTFLTGVNTLYNGLVHTPGIEKVDFSKLSFAMGGGAPVQKAVSDKWKALTGRHIIEGYGLSETSPVVTVNRISDTEFRSSIGLPIPSTIVSIRDDQGQPVPQGEAGEVCVKGPQVMEGYWNLEEKNAEVFTDDGFFCTGDIGVEDEGGFFRIVDRKKDMILVSGFNVFPNEIEDVAARMEGIIECACIGVPDDKTGEAVRLFVVANPEAGLDEAKVRGFCRDALTAYKVPKTVTFIAELPKSTVGKILRRELRDMALAGKI